MWEEKPGVEKIGFTKLASWLAKGNAAIEKAALRATAFVRWLAEQQSIGQFGSDALLTVADVDSESAESLVPAFAISSQWCAWA